MAFSNSPRVVKGGIVLVDPDTGKVQRVIALQYNPEKLTRSLKVQRVGAGAEQSDARPTSWSIPTRTAPRSRPESARSSRCWSRS
jgi:hypothetical protein